MLKRRTRQTELERRWLRVRVGDKAAEHAAIYEEARRANQAKKRVGAEADSSGVCLARLRAEGGRHRLHVGPGWQRDKREEGRGGLAAC
jgi:hypothetical protein